MPTVMIIDDSVTNLTMASKVLESHYRIQPIPSGEKALALLARTEALPDLVLLDLNMPGLNGFDVIKQLKAEPRTAAIPVIFLTGQEDDGSELEGLSLGAVDYIRKPFSPPLLIQRIKLHLQIIQQQLSLAEYSRDLEKMVEKKTKDVVDFQFAVIDTMTDLIEKRDGFTGGHVHRTQAVMERLTRAYINAYPDCGLKQEDVGMLSFYSKLHDVGKIGVPDRILLKDNKLDDDEIEIIRLHTEYGAQALEKSSRQMHDNEYLAYAVDMARYHHERWDGKGYPTGLAGAQIPLVARLLAVADVYDALASVRSYKPALPHAEVSAYIQAGSGTQFDPKVVTVFAGLWQL